jgi:hypothetical protein
MRMGIKRDAHHIVRTTKNLHASTTEKVNFMPKKTKEHLIDAIQNNTIDRETKILNVMCNISILLMSLVTEAFSDLFTGIAEGMVQAISANLNPSEENIKERTGEIQDLETKIPRQFREQMITMKTDIQKQIQERKQDILALIADPVFDKGIAIAEHYNTRLPRLTQDLDELSLLSYIALLKENDPQCTKMFQELMEWMKTVPQPPK